MSGKAEPGLDISVYIGEYQFMKRYRALHCIIIISASFNHLPSGSMMNIPAATKHSVRPGANPVSSVKTVKRVA